MKLDWKSFFCAAVLWGAVFSAHAIRLEGVDVEEQTTLADSPLVLNGAGVRKTHFIKAYVASLYLPGKAALKEDVVRMSGPKRFQMVMLIGADSKEFSKALIKGMRRNSTEEEFARLEERMRVFESHIDSLVKVKQGDIVRMDYFPGAGMVLSLNGRAHGAPIVGEEFYGKLLEIFIGAHVSDGLLRQNLLGK
jgi:Chalcone isomerase-like